MIIEIISKRLQVDETRSCPITFAIDTARSENFMIWSQGEGHGYIGGYIQTDEVVSGKWDDFFGKLRLGWIGDYIRSDGNTKISPNMLLQEIRNRSFSNE